MAKKNAADAAVEAVETETKGKRTRTKREVIYKAVPAGTTVHEHKMPGADWSEAQAVDALKKLAGDDCEILGPFYSVKGNNSESESIAVKISLRDLKPTTKQYEGTHKGWNFFANGVKKVTVNGEQFADNDLLDVEFESPVDPEAKQAKPRFAKGMLIRRTALENCVEAE